MIDPKPEPTPEPVPKSYSTATAHGDVAFPFFALTPDNDTQPMIAPGATPGIVRHGWFRQGKVLFTTVMHGWN